MVINLNIPRAISYQYLVQQREYWRIIAEESESFQHFGISHTDMRGINIFLN